jgi:hypothetical protein
MPRQQKGTHSPPLPAEPDADKLPRYGDRKLLAHMHRKYYGPMSDRTLEKWPLDWRRLNGHAVTEVRAFLTEAQKRFDAAPVLMGGRRVAPRRRIEPG